MSGTMHLTSHAGVALQLPLFESQVLQALASFEVPAAKAIHGYFTRSSTCAKISTKGATLFGEGWGGPPGKRSRVAYQAGSYPAIALALGRLRKKGPVTRYDCDPAPWALNHPSSSPLAGAWRLTDLGRLLMGIESNS